MTNENSPQGSICGHVPRPANPGECHVCLHIKLEEAQRQLEAVQRIAHEALKGVEQGDEGVELSTATLAATVASAIGVRDAQIERLTRENEALQATPGPWEACGPHAKGEGIGHPKAWIYVKHNFPNEPYEGQLDEEWGVYPPLGESGPVALVAGEGNARLIAQAPTLNARLEEATRKGELLCCQNGDLLMVLHRIKRAYGGLLDKKTEAEVDRVLGRNKAPEAQKNWADYRRAGDGAEQPCNNDLGNSERCVLPNGHLPPCSRFLSRTS